MKISSVMKSRLSRVNKAGAAGCVMSSTDRTNAALESRGLIRAEPCGRLMSVRWIITDTGRRALGINPEESIGG